MKETEINSGQLLTLEKSGKFTNALAYSGAIVYPEAYPNGLIIDLSSIKINHSVPLLYQHKPFDVVGLTEQTAVANGVFASGQLASNNDLAETIKAGEGWQLSIGVMALSEQVPETTQTINGIAINAPITVWRDSTVKEISLTKAPHDPNTKIQFFAKKEVKPMSDEAQTLIAELSAKAQDLAEKDAKIAQLSADLAEKDAKIELLTKQIAEIELANKKALLSKSIDAAGLKEAAAKYEFMLKLSGDDFNAALETIALAKKPELPDEMQHLSKDLERQTADKPKTGNDFTANYAKQLGAK